MAATDGRPLSSADPCISIINGLLRYRLGDDGDPFPRKAIESLVRKLKEKRDELDMLIMAVTSRGGQSTKCVTIPRTLDGRLQVAARKGFPHVVYIRIWRWPDVHKNELRHTQHCQYAFDMKKDNICINPYHYERIATTGLDLAGLSIHHSAANPLYSGMEGYALLGGSQLSPPYGQQSSADEVLSPAGDDSYAVGKLPTSAVYSAPVHLGAMKANPLSLLPENDSSNSVSGWVSQQQQATAMPHSWHDSEQHRGDHVQHTSHHVSMVTSACGSNIGSLTETISPIAIDSKPVDLKHNPLASYVAPSDLPRVVSLEASPDVLHPFNRLPPVSTDPVLRPLSSRPLPEIWCSITYFEQDQKVGEIFKVPSNCQRVTVDGYTNPSSPDRFCIGKLTNVNRTDVIDKARLHIGKGVQLVLEGEGDVWVRCLSEHSIFVQSFYLDRESGRQPGDAIHKIYPAAFIKVFDLNQCYNQMHQCVVMAQSTLSQSNSLNLNVTSATVPCNDTSDNLPLTTMMGISVDDLRQLCVVRLSFVKGWGPDYPRPTIKDTPCWIEIQLHRPLQLLDELLQTVTVTNSNGGDNDML